MTEKHNGVKFEAVIQQGFAPEGDSQQKAASTPTDAPKTVDIKKPRSNQFNLLTNADIAKF